MHSVKLEIKYALDVLWRRRWLLITPILIMIPASFLFAQYGPKTYIAKAILVLQESGGNNPLLRSDRSDGDRMSARFDGFRALAGSDKVLRAEPFAAQVNVGNVMMLRAEWNDALISELRMFPNGAHDDQVDALSDAFSELNVNTFGLLELMAAQAAQRERAMIERKQEEAHGA